MEKLAELRRLVRQARWRLGWQQLVGRLGWCWSASLLAAVGLIVVDKYHPLRLAPWAWIAGAAVLGLLAAAVWTFAARKSDLAAALEIDRRYGLKERVSSTLALPPEQQETAAGRALIADAAGRAARIDVAEKFVLRPPRQILLPLLPGASAVLVALLMSPAAVDDPAAAAVDPAAAQKQVRNSAETLRQKLADRREQAQELGMADAEELFKKLEQGSKDLAASSPQRKQALIELSDLSRQLQARRQELQGTDKLKQQLEQLKNLGRGPADKFAQAVSKGDFKRAVEELRKLQDQLGNNQLNPEQKADVAKQLEQMQQKLNQLADAQQAAQSDLQKRIEQMRQAGQTAEADQLAQQLNRLREQAPQMQQLSQLANQLGQAAKGLGDGNLKDARDALQNLQSELGNLQKQLDEIEMLDGAFDQLVQAKDQMTCPHCGGEGCEWCQGDKLGPGRGTGRGVGERPEARSETATYDSHVKQKVGEGSAMVIGTAGGPNVKGNVQQEIQRQFESAREGSTDPLSGHQIPRKLRQHAQEYFDRFREGE